MFPMIALMGAIGIPVLMLAAELNLEEHGQTISVFSIATLVFAGLTASLGFVKNARYQWAVIVLLITVPSFSFFQIVPNG
tara:strand:+ start:628 stop:867 length:240 start_codon:yes stop_codon:yes gene_type:complete